MKIYKRYNETGETEYRASYYDPDVGVHRVLPWIRGWASFILTIIRFREEASGIKKPGDTR